MLTVDSTNDGARVLMAAALLRLGQVDQARAQIDTVRDDGKTSGLSWFRGSIALAQDDYSQARDQLARAAAAPNAPAPVFLRLADARIALGDSTGALAALSRAAALDPASLQAEFMRIGVYVQNRRYDDAPTVVDGLTVKHAPPALRENLRGVILVAKGDGKLARARFEQALRLDPNYTPAYANLANLDLQAKDYPSARNQLQKLLDRTPADAHAWTTLAQVATLNQETTHLRAYLDKAEQADSHYLAPRLILIRYWLERDNPGQALVEARDGLNTTGEEVFRLWSGEALLRLRDDVAAAADFQQLLQNRSDLAAAWVGLARAEIGMDDVSQAMRSLGQALSLQPDHPAALAVRDVLLRHNGGLGDKEKLAREIQTQLTRTPAFARVDAGVRASNYVEYTLGNAALSPGAPAVVLRAKLAPGNIQRSGATGQPVFIVASDSGIGSQADLGLPAIFEAVFGPHSVSGGPSGNRP